MRKELLATFLISAYWMIAGFFVAYSAWDRGFMVNPNYGYQSALPDPVGMGIVLAIIGVIFTFVLVRTLLPSRATQRKRLMRLLDDIGMDEIDAIQRKLAALPEENTSLETLIYEQKRKNRAD